MQPRNEKFFPYASKARTLTGETRGTPAARIDGHRNPYQFTVAATS